MQIIIVIFYTLLCAWAITIIPFFKQAKIEKPYLISIFFGKIIVGIAYGILMQKQQITSGLPTDTWKYFNYSLQETQVLLNTPSQFFKELFTNHYGEDAYTTIWASTGSFWADFKNWFFVSILAVLNVFTNGNYIADLVIVNFLCFFGWVGIYKVLTHKLQFKPLLAFLITFCIPSTLFWNSGLHKDAFIFNSIGCLLWYCFKTEWKYKFKKIAVIGFHVFVVFCFRYYTLIFLMAGLAGFYAYSYFKIKGRHILMAFFIFVFGLIFASPFLPSSLSLPNIFLQKQIEFFKLKANSDFNFNQVPVAPLRFIANIPYALKNVFASPSITQAKGINGYISFIEIFGILGLSLLAVFLFFKNKKLFALNKIEKSFILFSVLFIFTAAITIGFININMGSIVRYRSILLPFLVAVGCVLGYKKWVVVNK